MLFEIWMKISLPGRMQKVAGRKYFESLTEFERSGMITVDLSAETRAEQGLPPVLCVEELICACETIRNATTVRACLQMHRVSSEVEYTIREAGAHDENED